MICEICQGESETLEKFHIPESKIHLVKTLKVCPPCLWAIDIENRIQDYKTIWDKLTSGNLVR